MCFGSWETSNRLQRVGTDKPARRVSGNYRQWQPKLLCLGLSWLRPTVTQIENKIIGEKLTFFCHHLASVFKNSFQAKSSLVTCDLFDLCEQTDVWQRLLDDSVPTTLWLQLPVSLYPRASVWHQNPAMMSWTSFACTNWLPLPVTRRLRASFLSMRSTQSPRSNY